MTKAKRRSSLPLGCLGTLAVSIMVCVIGWETLQYSWYQSLLPAGIEAPLVEYKRFRNYGFGPGGDEAGLIVYRMSERSARLLERDGIDHLLRAAEAEPGRSRRTYWEWRATPVVLDRRWTSHGEHSCGREPSIGSVVDYADFRCGLRPSVVDRIDRIVFASGAYYASGRGSSMIIVAPRERLVVLAYNG